MFNALRAAATAAIHGPFLIAAKPLMFNALRAAATAAIHGLFLPLAESFLETILPALFLTRSPLERPEAVLVLLPAKTWRLARRAETFFMAFIAFMAFMAFIAFMAFMAAIVKRRGVEESGEWT